MVEPCERVILASNAFTSSTGTILATLTVGQLDDEVMARLRQQAAAAGHSMEQEARDSPDESTPTGSQRRHRAAASSSCLVRPTVQ
jgi:plasmid stability protein